MLKKVFKFVLSKKSSIIILNLGFLLLLAEVNPILEKGGCKKDVFVVCNPDFVKIIFVLLTKVITLYMQVFIIQIGVLAFKK